MGSRAKKRRKISRDLIVGKFGKLHKLPPKALTKLQDLERNPTTTGVLEFLTGGVASFVDKPSSLIISVGRLVQSFASHKFCEQLYKEIQRYRKLGAIPDENLNTNTGNTFFVDLLRTIDTETLDKGRFEALKTIFLKAVWKGTDEHEQIVAYEYFQVCKELTSLDVLVLKVAYEMYKNREKEMPVGDAENWEAKIAGRLGLPSELVSQSRINNSPVSQTPNTSIFDTSMVNKTHGLSALGIEIGRVIDSSSLEIK